MENVSIFLENGVPTQANGIFYIFNSKYYFMYTLGELVDQDYVQLYVVQVCKEVQDTIKGPVDTGYMIGVETSDPEAWKMVQGSITKIVNDKKNDSQSGEIRYLPITMLSNLKIVSKNKFKLSKALIENSFKLTLDATPSENPVQNNDAQAGVVNSEQQSDVNNEPINQDENDNVGAIIDYRAKFFDEQEKNEKLQEQLNTLQEKLNKISEILS